MFEILPPLDPERLKAAWAGHSDWVVFTSANAVRACADLPRKHDVLFAVVGEQTAKAMNDILGIQADMVGTGDANALAKLLQPVIKNKKIMLPVSSKADATMEMTLRSFGALPTRVDAYQNLPRNRALLLYEWKMVKDPDAMVFCSSSAVERFSALKLSLNPLLPMFSIGPSTSKTMKLLGFNDVVQASEPSMPALVSALEQHFS